VTNISLAGPANLALERVIQALTGRDIWLVAAAGNEGPLSPPRYPAAYPGVIAVTAIDADLGLYPKANRGDYIDFAAPGVEVISTGLRGRYPAYSGTSFAAPHVAGVVAMILERSPGLQIEQVERRLRESAGDLGPRGRDPEFGNGRVDACDALAGLDPKREQPTCL